MFLQFALGLCAAIAGSVLAGCGSQYSGGERYPLAGQVTFDGVPVDLGSISFIPTGGAEGGGAAGGDAARASGGVITDGKYDIPEEKGANAGTYRVEIHWLKRTGKQLLDAESGEYYDERVEALPEKFHAKSELTVEVPLPSHTHEFQLTSG
ncbi:MAG: hypothetical protein L0211_01100 [Planctomycetaceae bacterium]|nr:hypothetical protein [Planctomycetaceae bacterium]